MEKRKIFRILLVVLLGLVGLAGIGLYIVWPRNHLEVQLEHSERSPDGNWVAVVQLEVFNTAWVVNDPIYAVRLKGRNQRDNAGDLVMYVPVNYPDPAPSIEWSDGKLVVILANHEKYQYLANPVNGIPIAVQQK
jgi:hypothetical protein